MLTAKQAKDLSDSNRLERFMQEHTDLTTYIAQRIECAASEGEFEVQALIPNDLVEPIKSWLSDFGYLLKSLNNPTSDFTLIRICWRG